MCLADTGAVHAFLDGRDTPPKSAQPSIELLDATFAKLGKDFEDRDTVVLGGSTDNEFVKLAWRRDHADLSKLPIWQFADNGGKFARDLGVLDEAEGVALRATFDLRAAVALRTRLTRSSATFTRGR